MEEVLSRLFRPENHSPILRWTVAILLIGSAPYLSGCQLLALPFFAVSVFGNLASQLIARAFVLPFQLLPLAIKYAPLALLFLEKSSADETYYVKWLRPEASAYRVEHFMGRNGHEVTAILTPADALNTDLISKMFSIGSDSKVLLLTSHEFDKSTVKDLADAWELLRTRPQTVWMAGTSAERFRKENLVAYI